MKIFLDTWVLVERYKGNADALRLLRMTRDRFEAHVSHVTVAELMNVVSREYGEREARVQYAFLKHSPLLQDGTSEDIAKNAGLYKTKYGFSLADAFVLSSAIDCGAEVLITGGERQYEEEWKEVKEIRVAMLSDFIKTV
jgi:predicted nucleic acid-binding protein